MSPSNFPFQEGGWAFEFNIVSRVNMLVNPQEIVRQSFDLGSSSNSECLPDSVYIPFLDRYENLNALLKLLQLVDREIVILVSDNCDSSLVDISQNENVKIVNCTRHPSTDKVKNLKTFKNSANYCSAENWDLPLKRNFALLHARQNGYDRILLIDDDIEGFSVDTIKKGILALENDSISGCLVKGFPDTSVIGHIEQKYGEPYFPFLSGNFLFINQLKAESYFPMIYNEDWLFMVPEILKGKVSSVDVVKQKLYDPFDNIKRVRFQEFGEIIAEGIFELISQSDYASRLKEQFWEDYIKYRQSYVLELQVSAEAELIPFINESLRVSNLIKGRDCIRFISDWEEDIATFGKIRSNEAQKSKI